MSIIEECECFCCAETYQHIGPIDWGLCSRCMSEPERLASRASRKPLHDYKRLTVRINADKLKALKIALMRKDMTLQDFVMKAVDQELKEPERNE